MIRFRLTEEANPHYLKTFFNSEIGKGVTEQLASGAVQKNLTSKALLNVRIPLPTRLIQDRIMDALGHVKCPAIDESLASLQNLQKALNNKIF